MCRSCLLDRRRFGILSTKTVVTIPLWANGCRCMIAFVVVVRYRGAVVESSSELSDEDWR
jgi:hypothetical protein